MKDRVLEFCKKIIVSTEEEFSNINCEDIKCIDCPLGYMNNFDRMRCSDRDYNKNIEIAENYIKDYVKSIKESVKTTNYEYITKSKEIGISKNGYDEYVIHYDIPNKPKFFMAFKTFEMTKEIADKLDEVYYLGYTKR